MKPEPDCLIQTVRDSRAQPGLCRLRLDNLQPAFLPLRAGHNVYGRSLELDCRARLVFRGPSGCGKTTLFRYFLGLPVPGTGRRTFLVAAPPAGKQPDLSPPDRQQRRGPVSDLAGLRARELSMVPQDFRLIPRLSLRQNTELALQAWRLAGPAGTPLPGGQAAWPDLDSQARRLDLADKLDQPVATLSRGEQQRGALLRALARPFNLLVADEAFSHLDSRRRESALALILELAERQQAGIWFLDLPEAPVPGDFQEFPL